MKTFTAYIPAWRAKQGIENGTMLAVRPKRQHLSDAEVTVTYTEPPKTKKVYQWTYKNENTGNWLIARRLLTEEEALKQFELIDIKKISGPYEVTV